MKQKMILALIIILSFTIFIGACNSGQKIQDEEYQGIQDQEYIEAGAMGPCSNYSETFSLAVSSQNPDICSSEVDSEECTNECLANYAWQVPDKEYCKYATNPLNTDDLANIENCYVHIAQVTNDESICDEINYNLEGYGYLHYRTNEAIFVFASIEDSALNFSAEITPKTYCKLLATEKIEECANLDASDVLKDACLLKYVTKDVSNPAFTGNLPFNCEDMKTEQGKQFCELLKTSKKMYGFGAIGTE
ncbi:MAG: hypothetical protein ACP5N2_06870 [Candidatus Nanoarchaeia archaeon]